MITTDRAASGPAILCAVFDLVPAEGKKLVWLGARNQLQFCEDPLTIDLVARSFGAA